MHQEQYLQTLTMSELIALQSITKKKMTYYQEVYKMAEQAEAENQDDYGMLATAQAEMDSAEVCIMRCEQKLRLLETLIKS